MFASLRAGGKPDGTNVSPCRCCEAVLQHLPTRAKRRLYGACPRAFGNARNASERSVGNGRSAIFSTKTGEQIGYVEGAGAYDLNDRKRFEVDVNKNLVDPATGQVVGQLRDGGPFTGSGEAADSLFD